MNKYYLGLIALGCSILCAAHGVAAGIDLAGVSWNATPETVLKDMSARERVKTGPQSSDTLIFTGGILQGQQIKSWTYRFKNRKLTELKIVFAVRQGENKKGYLADQDFAQLRAALEKSNGKGTVAKGKNFESCEWRLANPPQNVKLSHGWKTGVTGSSTMELTFQSRV